VTEKRRIPQQVECVLECFPTPGPTRPARRKSEYSRPIAVRKDFQDVPHIWGIWPDFQQPLRTFVALCDQIRRCPVGRRGNQAGPRLGDIPPVTVIPEISNPSLRTFAPSRETSWRALVLWAQEKRTHAKARRRESEICGLSLPSPNGPSFLRTRESRFGSGTKVIGRGRLRC
jgi:hypothetical protein